MKKRELTPENCTARVSPMYSLLCEVVLGYSEWGLKTPYGIIKFDTERDAKIFQHAFKGD